VGLGDIVTSRVGDHQDAAAALDRGLASVDRDEFGVDAPARR